MADHAGCRPGRDGAMRPAAVLLATTALLALPGAVAARSSKAIAPLKAFAYTGHEQTYTVPRGVVLLGIAVDGGHGGQHDGQAGQGGGGGGGVGALLPTTPGQRLYVEVGAAGVHGGGPVFGGGGAAGAPPPVLGRSPQGGTSNTAFANSGGGASDVRTCSLTARCPGGAGSAGTRLIVAGGGGGESGNGNSPLNPCTQDSAGGSASNFQFPPGNPGAGPVPIRTSAGTVFPGRPTTDHGSPGVTPAGGGGATPGTGGAQAGCTGGGNGSVSFSDSIAGSPADGPVGGTGGNASSLGPSYAGCSMSIGNCFDAGAGGGGGGGYFGGGGGATGLDRASGNCGTCNTSGSGQGGGGGSSFVSSRMLDPVPGPSAGWNGQAVLVPVIEIDAPAPGAVYKRGQVVRAAWECDYDGTTGLGISSGCKGTVADGARISTAPGRHRFTVGGTVDSNGRRTVSATVTYTVR